MDDPKVTIMGILEADWNAAGLGFTPKFNADWYEPKQEIPQITVTQVGTIRRHLFMTDDPTTTDRRNEGRYAIDVWALQDSARRWSMIEEVTRIIKAKCNALGGDIEFGDISNWTDLDETQTRRKILRSRAFIDILWWS